MGEVLYGSEFINETESVINISDRAFNYGDGFFETIKIINAKPFNFSTHYNRFSLSCRVLKLQNKETEESLYSLVIRVIKRNKLKNGNIRVHIHRIGKGRYLPNSNSSKILISAHQGLGFQKNASVSLCVFSDIKKVKGDVSNIKSCNSLVYILAAINAKECGYDNAILINTDYNLIEATNSNIFIIKDEIIYTPPLTEGCVDGTMRRWVMDQEKVIAKALTLSDVKKADEIFLTNATNGIIPVDVIDCKSKITYNMNFSKYLHVIIIQSL